MSWWKQWADLLSHRFQLYFVVGAEKQEDAFNSVFVDGLRVSPSLPLLDC
jgi:hypothetical protein